MSVNMNLMKSCHNVPLGKKLQCTPAGGQLQLVTYTAGAITFYLRVHCDKFSSDSVRAHVFQQLLCITYALTHNR